MDENFRDKIVYSMDHSREGQFIVFDAVASWSPSNEDIASWQRAQGRDPCGYDGPLQISIQPCPQGYRIRWKCYASCD